MKTKHNHAFTLIELLVVITIIAILASLAVPAFTMVQTQGNQMKGVSNCKQIIASLKLFSKDNNSMYPDMVNNQTTGGGAGGGGMSGGMATTANVAFRRLIYDQIVTDERIFGCPAGYNPDSNLGMPPGYGMALQAGENHWAMTAGQTDTTPGNMPIIFENPSSVGWPPQWNADVAGQIRPGRTWPGGKIIIGRNDGSVAVEPLNGKKGMVGPKMMAGGLNIFTQAFPGQRQQVLNIELGGGAMGGNNGGAAPAFGQQQGGFGQQPGGFGAPGGFAPPGGAPGGFAPPGGGAPGGFAPQGGGAPPPPLGNQ